MNIGSCLKAFSTVTGEAKKISDDLKQINNNFPWLNFQNITFVLFISLVSILIGDIYQPVTSTSLLKKQQRENISKNVVADKYSSVDNALLDKNKISDQTDVIKEKEINSKKEIITTESKQIEIIAVEFVSNNIFEKGIAASCDNSEFYNKQIELKNPFDLKNNTIVDVIKPINCENENRAETTQKCGTFPRMQIPFSNASELFPTKQNLQKNITSLDRCELVQVEMIQDN